MSTAPTSQPPVLSDDERRRGSRPPELLPRGITGRIPSLDGIRAVAFAIVFLSHVEFGRLIPGHFGVTVFFVLSGFLITTLLRDEAEATGTISLRHFYLRRALRILPPLYLVLAIQIACVWIGLNPERLVGWKIGLQAAQLANYMEIRWGLRGTAEGTGVLWSLAVEEHFYLVFPMLYLLTRRLGRRGQGTLFLGLCLVVMVWRAVLHYRFHAPPVRLGAGTDTRVDAILYGCVLALVCNPTRDRIPFSRATWVRLIFPASLALLVASFLVRNNQAFLRFGRFTFQPLALLPIFVAAVRFPDLWTFRWLNTRWIAFGGALSYTLYLIHLTAIRGVYNLGLRGPLAALAALLASLIVALAMYRWVERPCAKLRRKLHQETSSLPPSRSTARGQG